VFFSLAGGGEKSITQIADEAGQSHPAVSQVAREMVKNGFLKEKKDKADGRKNLVCLTAKAKAVAGRISFQYDDVHAVVEDILSQTDHNIWKAIAEWEFLLDKKSLLARVTEQKKQRESNDVIIVPYRPAYKKLFRDMNEAWISTYFKMEEADYKSLNHPDDYILANGGKIIFALYNNEPVGTCALIKMDDTCYELAKMAVTPAAQGKGIGFILGNAAIRLAREAGAKRVYLESNTRLKPAINLYVKLGFKKVTGNPSPYERSNIQMELLLDEKG
jgi:GNAT superfamily N-acetyltransferase